MEKHIVNIDVDYLGDLRTKVTHEPSGTGFLTDAPLDNLGKAEYISPTDLAGASIGSCVATIMGIKARQKEINIEGLHIRVSKEMVNEPYRRIAKLSFVITFPRKLKDEDFKLLSNVVKTCPVTRSLHPDIKLDYKFSFKE
ncbi:MAG: OsmC family protein [Candidatus Kapaibacterium sp.]